MFLLGGAVLKASVTDMYLRYVKESLQPFLIASAVLLLVAAAMTLWYDLRVPATATAGGGHGGHSPDPVGCDPQSGDDGHGHHREPRVGWFLLLPVLGLLLVAPPALGSDAAGRSGSVLASQEVAEYPPLPEGDPAKITVLDYASRAVFDEGRSLGSRNVQLSGFIAPGPDGAPMLVRMILSCCAADGRPIKVGLAGNAPTDLPEDTWVEVQGRYTAKTTRDPVNNAYVPYLEVTEWRQIEAPKQQYE